MALVMCIGAVGAPGGAARTAAGPAPSFAAAKSYATGKKPDAPVIADLNGDGKPDLVTRNTIYRRSDTVSVLLNRGDGSFEAKRDYATGKAAYSLAIGDLNGDGKPDLVTANNGAATLSVLLNRGDGSFEAKRDYATGRGPDSLAIGDLNGDGRPDLAVANAYSSTVSVLLNRGDGSFEAKHDVATTPYTSPYLLRLAELNGDGVPDMLFIDGNPIEPALVVLLNNGDGSFQAGHYYGAGGGSGSGSTTVESVAIADLNGDGSPDVATSVIEDFEYWKPVQGTLSVFLNKGDGTFEERSYNTGRTHSREMNVVASDLNGDGRPDLATAAGRISVLVNRGNGSFQAKVEYPGGAPLASADLNGDEKPDLVTTGDRSLHVLINNPGLCNVQGVVGMTPAAAKRELARVNCRVGKVSRASSNRAKKGRVISQKPRFGAVLPGGGRVNLVVSRGKKRR